MKTAIFISLVALSLSCGGPLDCSPRTVTPTGDVSKDILGSWDSFGVDSRVVATFHADGGVTMTEQPNQYAPTGGSGSQSYSVLSDGGVMMAGTVSSASFTSSDLTLSEDGGMARVHPALTCRGKSFD